MSLGNVSALSPNELAERRRRSKRAAILLGLVAAAFYIGFIILTFYRGSHGGSHG